ncbi:acyl-CoA dehydrogenase family protein [Streptomyces sp. NPDC049555]|uniref:acyl-CoA dehydrogenase family protein n=1 Tax=Streptomyces sp. NPDC049555 TaxID=3154930 RepID=UPI00341E9833
MDAALSEEQHQIKRTLRDLLAGHAPPHKVRAAADSPAGYDEELWRRLAKEVGLAGLAVERRYGGAGCGPVEPALAFEETGRALLPSPLLATCALAAPLVAALGTSRQRDALLPRLAGGDLTGTLVVPRGTLPEALGLTGAQDGEWAGGARAGGVQARRTPTGWRLYGEAPQVLDGHSAGLLLVAACAGGPVRPCVLLFAVDPAQSRVRRVRLVTLDQTRPQARLEFRDAEARPLGPDGADARAALAALAGGVSTALAAEAVGAAERVLELTVQYARVREQFGRPIGSFQAIKHRLADLYVAVCAARSAVYYAVWSGRAAAGALALAQALETARTVAAEGVQLHGGIGVTWEHDVQLYFKRVNSDELLFGPVHRLRARAAELAGLFDPQNDREAVVL